MQINTDKDRKDMTTTIKDSSNTLDSRTKDRGTVNVIGHLKIYDPLTNEVIVDKRNAIHYENFAIALAKGISNQGNGFIAEMVFGNGGTRIDQTGIVTYLTPNVIGTDATLYNETYYKNVDAKDSINNVDPSRNYMEVRHVAGTAYADILVSCLLDFGEPEGQEAFDNSTNSEGSYVFDEIGLRSYSNLGPGAGELLTHVIFHPVQKSLNRMIQIDYTVRVQSLTSEV
jgi:hypothetical protein